MAEDDTNRPAATPAQPVATLAQPAATPAQPVAVDETDRLIASDKVQGTEVFGRDGERLGSVYNFMVDKVTGRVAYAVLSFGGLLGLGERYHPLP